MRSLVLYFITHRRVTTLVLLLILLLGVISALRLDRQAYPAIDFDIVKVITKYPGASPEDVEINVTEPLEDEILDVEDIDEVISRSMENLSMITIYLNPDARDLAKVKNNIRDAIDRVSDLPPQVKEKPLFMEFRSGNRTVMEIALSGDAPEKELRSYAKTLANNLRGVNGIGRISKVGYNKREIKIEAQPGEIENRYVSLNEIMGAVQARNIRVTGGSLESYVTEKNIVTFSEFMDPLDVKDVIIRSTFTGQGIRISDIAEISDGFEEPDELTKANGRRNISILIRAQENSDIIAMTDEVKKQLEEFKKGLPKNIDATLIFDDSRYTRSLLSVVYTNAIMGFCLIVLVLFFFLDRKSAIWTAIAMPIAICASLALFKPLGITINSVTLIAMILVLGMLVDHSIVISEKIYKLKEGGMKPAAATIQGLESVFWPVTAAVLTTIFAFLPMRFMSGVTGKFVACIPIVVTLLLLMSLAESVIFLPSHLIRGKPPQTESRRMRWINSAVKAYHSFITLALKHRGIVMGLFAAAFILTTAAASHWLKFVLFPQEDPDLFNVVIEAPAGTSLNQTEQKVGEIEKILDEMVPPEIRESFTTRIGHHDTGVYGSSEGHFENWAMITVYLKPAGERDEVSSKLMDRIQTRLKSVEGFTRLTVEGVDEGPPTGKPVTVTYATDDKELLKRFEDETLTFLSGVDGIYDIETTNRKGKQELRLKLDYDLMARLGITAADVAGTVRAAFEGNVVTSLRREGEEVDFRVNLKDPKQYQAEGVLALMISNRAGKLVPLGKFARLEESESPSVIFHHDGVRSTTITAEVDTNKITSVKANKLIRDKFGPEQLKFANVKMTLGGEEKSTKESLESFFIALSIAMIANYVLLVILFNSFAQPLLIMVTVPLAMIGVFVTLLTHGLPMGFVAMIGVLGLVGVVVNDAIVMIGEFNETNRGFSFTLEDVANVATDRFRPVIMCSLTTVAGLFPTAYGIGGDVPFIRPMVLVMAWGLIFSNVISLIFVPAIYSLLKRIPSKPAQITVSKI